VDEHAAPGRQGLAIENERLRDQQRALGDVLRAVATSTGLEPVLDEIVEAATRLCRGEHGQLYLADGDVFRIFSQTTHNVDGAFEFAAQHPHARDRTTVVGRVAGSGGVEQIPDVVADPEYTYEGQQIVGFKSLLGVPVMLDGELIGVIAVGRNVAGRFEDDDVELVKTFADQAAVAIANARLIDAVKRQRAELSRFVSPAVADLISSEEGQRLLAGHRGYISCLFCDMRGFTAFSETAAPEELLDVLRAYHELLGRLIPAHSGTLEHFAGDGVMVFFNDPVETPQHELQAVRLALEAREGFAELAAEWRKRGIQLGIGIGIEAGYATLGRIGFEGRYDYGVVGPVTSLASRLSTHAEAGQILVGQRVFGAVEEYIEASPFGELDLKGFGRPVPAYVVHRLRPA